MIFLIAALGVLLLAFAVRPLARWRARRSVERALRRSNFERMLEDARRVRLAREIEAEGDRIPWH